MELFRTALRSHKELDPALGERMVRAAIAGSDYHGANALIGRTEPSASLLAWLQGQSDPAVLALYAAAVTRSGNVTVHHELARTLLALPDAIQAAVIQHVPDLRPATLDLLEPGLAGHALVALVSTTHARPDRPVPPDWIERTLTTLDASELGRAASRLHYSDFTAACALTKASGSFSLLFELLRNRPARHEPSLTAMIEELVQTMLTESTSASRDAALAARTEDSGLARTVHAFGSWPAELTCQLLARTTDPLLREQVESMLRKKGLASSEVPTRERIRAWAREGTHTDLVKVMSTYVGPEDPLFSPPLPWLSPEDGVFNNPGLSLEQVLTGQSDEWLEQLAESLVDESIRALDNGHDEDEVNLNDWVISLFRALDPALLAPLLAQNCAEGYDEFVRTLVLTAAGADGARLKELLLLFPSPVIDSLTLETDVAAVVMDLVSARLGDDPARWDSLTCLSKEFEGSLGELLDVCSTL